MKDLVLAQHYLPESYEIVPKRRSRGWQRGVPMPEATKRKISAAKLGRPRSPETRAAISEGMKRSHAERRQLTAEKAALEAQVKNLQAKVGAADYSDDPMMAQFAREAERDAGRVRYDDVTYGELLR
jgi:hypothetical protein